MHDTRRYKDTPKLWLNLKNPKSYMSKPYPLLKSHSNHVLILCPLSKSQKDHVLRTSIMNSQKKKKDYFDIKKNTKLIGPKCFTNVEPPNIFIQNTTLLEWIWIRFFNIIIYQNLYFKIIKNFSFFLLQRKDVFDNYEFLMRITFMIYHMQRYAY